MSGEKSRKAVNLASPVPCEFIAYNCKNSVVKGVRNLEWKKIPRVDIHQILRIEKEKVKKMKKNSRVKKISSQLVVVGS